MNKIVLSNPAYKGKVRGIYLVLLGVLILTSCNDHSDKRIMGRSYEESWHGSCKVASFFLPAYLDERIKYVGKFDIPSYDQIGDCSVIRTEGNLWYVQGTWFNEAMKQSNLPAIQYEATLYRSDDPLDVAVERYGPQYGLCHIKIDGSVPKGRVGISENENCK